MSHAGDIDPPAAFEMLTGDPDTVLVDVRSPAEWQFVGIPMMLIYAALLVIPEEVLEAAECDGITGMAQFWKI